MTSYRYEQLNDENFQQLCQSLLAKEFPGLQCFPVGQPDGGRDAVVRPSGPSSEKTDFILFQVKFSRHERNAAEARDWLIQTLKDELPKIEKQTLNGATRFVLVTNVSGTAHSEVGSIDKLQDVLDAHISIPAQAWWRDDIDRRLDNSWDLKFIYPALLTGADFLRIVAERGPSESRERRQDAISAFLSDQYNADRDVKFKQAELENDLFDLFTDVPLVPPNNLFDRRHLEVERLMSAFRRATATASDEVDQGWLHYSLEMAWVGESRLDIFHSRDEAWLGTAALLLDTDFQQAEPLVILEGAPGQGKSTIVQYICQVHRLRFLDQQRNGALEATHLQSPLRLPFKVELRDFATWLSGGNPFGTANDGDSLGSSPRSLEGFLSALVRYASGGSNFNVSDLQATLRVSSTLIVLDGLDEVAEIQQRQRVIDEITSAIGRLRALTSSLQVIVTSRPSAFTNAPALPRSTFATYSLGSLTRPLIGKYADRWLKSRAVERSAAAEVSEILDSKLDEPHLRDLARNPMQLAILLNLIHRRGESLPDKRTALYDSYVEMFFDRESEKAKVVKDNRDLLIRIHRYLAWVLHSEAEASTDSSLRRRPSGSSLSGTITESDLRVLLREFLERDGSKPALVEQLFSGMVERVVAIVSRVQGVYEFDVQTLREYFAARHLYETAPYSPPGDERRGTRSDRWRALSRNYYWLNVARFYAGCYSEGELSSLVDDLRSLSEDEAFRSTSHPQLLAATLLGDYVFSQRPRAVQDVVDLLLDPRAIRMLVAGAISGPSQFENVIVRDPAGKQRLIDACKDLMRPHQPLDLVVDIVRNVIRPNTDPEELLEWWIEELRSADEAQATHWCIVGELLQCWTILDVETAYDLLKRDNVPNSSVIRGLLHSNRNDVLESNEEIFGAAVESILSGESVGRTHGGSLLEKLTFSMERTFPVRHLRRNIFAGQAPLSDYLRRFRSYQVAETEIAAPDYDTAQRCTRLVQAFMSAAERPLQEWDTSTAPWNEIIQRGINEFGERRRFVELANIAASIRSAKELCEDSPDLLNSDRPLVRRARYARLRSNSRKWWSAQLEAATSPDEVWMVLLSFATWAGARTIEALADSIDRLIVGFGTNEWYSLYSSLHAAVELISSRSRRRPLELRVNELPSSLSARTISLFAARCTPAVADELYERFLIDFDGDDKMVISLRTDVQVQRALADEAKWSEALEGLRVSYSLGAPLSRVIIAHLGSDLTLPDTIARQIVDQPLQFPSALVRIAETHCRQLDASKVLVVGKVASDEDWFAD